MEEGFCPRSGHTAVRLGDSVLSVGGYDGAQRFSDVWLLDEEGTAKRVACSGAPFRGRAGHCMVAGEKAGESLVALGYDSGDNLLGDTMTLRVDDKGEAGEWEMLSSGGPARRWAACGRVAKGGMLIYGGWSESGPLNDCSLFDEVRRTWSPPLKIVGELPSPRRWAACDMVGGRLIIQGGYDGKTLGDAFAIDIVAGKSQKLPWQLARARHTLCGGKIIGGFDANGVVQRQVFFADETAALQRADESPFGCERAGHSAVVMENGSIALLAGFVGGAKKYLSSDLFIFK